MLLLFHLQYTHFVDDDKETETTIETGELLHDIEQEATIVTCVEGLNAETANYALSRIQNWH